MCSLGFFNFFGMSITKHVSSLARSILLISTTVIIWVYNLMFKGSVFHWQQLIGFLILVVGNLIYQRVIKINALEENYEKFDAEKESAPRTSVGKVSINEPSANDSCMLLKAGNENSDTEEETPVSA
mmetsp:Transcript_15811/g.18187  ORF Transcript_15811/g.18187 Transcript_15811/m.18187 type:complete len:127 (+) Transcript_15811:1-381(+)